MTTWHYYNPTFAYEQQFDDATYPWAGHKRFVYDLVRSIQPQCVVELGSYKGTSLFAMAQAIKDGQLTSALHAIDTWEGDPHAGEYGEEVFTLVQSIQKNHYHDVNITLHRTTFDAALEHFEDGSVDLLHIDGFHTYEAVSHDFQTWKKKLAPHAIVLFHDIAEKHDDFGVWKFWEECKKEYTTMEFHHSHGLGVLFMERQPDLAKASIHIEQVYAPQWHLENAEKIRKDKDIHIRNLEAERREDKEKLTSLKEQLRNQELETRELHRLAQEYAIVRLSLSYKLMRFHGSITTMLRNPKRTLQDVRLGMALLQREGVRSFSQRLQAYFQGQRLPLSPQAGPDFDDVAAYSRYIEQETWTPEQTRTYEELYATQEHTTISIIVPVYNIAPKYLDACINSVRRQVYPHWELCLYDDASTDEKTKMRLEELKQDPDKRIKVQTGETNLHIAGASNAAFTMTTGDLITLLDNDDELHAQALAEVMLAYWKNQPDIIYTDEDYMSTDGTRFMPYFKPDFSPELLLAHNYITHLLVFRRSLVGDEPLFRAGTEGAQDHDLILRLSEKTSKIHHIPKILYHWRYMEGSVSKDPASQKVVLQKAQKVLEDALERRGEAGTILPGNAPYFFRTKRTLISEPLVSIIIPFHEKPELLRMSIGSILDKSTYQNFEIIGIANNCSQKETAEEMRRLADRDARVRFVVYDVPFNYAKINNYGVFEHAKGDHVVLLNNDIEIITPDWIEAMLEHSQRPEVGAVGAKLYFPQNLIQHAGTVLGIGGVAGHGFKMFPRQTLGYFNAPNVSRNVSGVTAAMLMVKTSLYKQLEGLDEEFHVAFNDVDFCTRLHKAGLQNIYTPYAEAYHYESITRGQEDTTEKQERFKREIDLFQKKHGDLLAKGDPYYNPNLTLQYEDYRLKY